MMSMNVSSSPSATSSIPSLISAAATPTPSSNVEGTEIGHVKSDPIRIVLDCVFAVVALCLIGLFCLWRYLVLRRARLPMSHFFRIGSTVPLRSPPRRVPFPIPPPALPQQAYTRDREEVQRYEARNAESVDSLPVYDDKDKLPVYIEVVGPPPSFEDSHGDIPSARTSDGPSPDSNV